MLKLKEIAMPDVLKHAKTPEELAQKLRQFYNDELQEDLKSKSIKFIIPLLIGFYGRDFVKSAMDIVNFNSGEKISVKHDKTGKGDINRRVINAVEKYSKMYNVDKELMYSMLKLESSFTPDVKNYDPYRIGDEKNVLGPSLGAGQIKVKVALDFWKKHPDPGFKPTINKTTLLKDVDLNIRTMAKILSGLKHIILSRRGASKLNTKQLHSIIATAYNSGAYSDFVKSYTPSKYGKLAINSIGNNNGS